MNKFKKNIKNRLEELEENRHELRKNLNDNMNNMKIDKAIFFEYFRDKELEKDIDEIYKKIEENAKQKGISKCLIENIDNVLEKWQENTYDPLDNLSNKERERYDVFHGYLRSLDLHRDLNITAKEAALGTTKEIVFDRTEIIRTNYVAEELTNNFYNILIPQETKTINAGAQTGGIIKRKEKVGIKYRRNTEPETEEVVREVKMQLVIPKGIKNDYMLYIINNGHRIGYYVGGLYLKIIIT